MWQSKGRSGYGDTNLDGTYDDVILGVSPNGRQYRNEATLEQRDLSGWAYWNLRKQITPEQEIPEELYARNETESMSHTLANGKANLAKYADPVVVKKTTKVSIEDKILPQAKRIRTLTEQLIELEAARKAGMDINKYSKLRDILICKRERAEQLYQKAVAVKPTSASSTVGDGYSPIASNRHQIPVQNTGNEVKLAGHSAKAVKDDNKLFFGGILVCFIVWMVVKSFM